MRHLLLQYWHKHAEPYGEEAGVEVQELSAASDKAGVQLSIGQSSRCKKNAPKPSSTAKLARRKPSNPPDQKTILLYLPNQKY